jgi:hypothetical protein
MILSFHYQLNQSVQRVFLSQKLVIMCTEHQKTLHHPLMSYVCVVCYSRPVRSSKKRALEQVKSWCGSMTKKEFETGITKIVFGVPQQRHMFIW